MLNIEHVCDTYMPISKTMVIGGVLLKDLLWRAASSYTQIGFYAAMEVLKGLNPKAYEYL